MSALASSLPPQGEIGPRRGGQCQKAPEREGASDRAGRFLMSGRREKAEAEEEVGGEDTVRLTRSADVKFVHVVRYRFH